MRLTKNGNFIKDNVTYIESEHCKSCGEMFLGRTNKNNECCCKECGKAHKKNSINTTRLAFEKEGYTLLTETYKNSNQKLDYICIKGHVHKISWRDWNNGHRCPYCVNLAKPSIVTIKKSFESEGYALLSNFYRNSHSKLKYSCPNRHTYSISWSNWRSGKRCKLCASEGRNCNFWKGGVSKLNLPLFDTYAHQLDFAEEVRSHIDKGGIKLLEVRCSKCGRWFVPSIVSVRHRIEALNNNICGEAKLYCSQECKDSCEVYRKNSNYYLNLTLKKFPYTQKELQIWSQEVFKRANYTCEICGEPVEHAHHIQPKKLEPGLALDPDNGLALCKNCHSKYGHKEECSLARLASTVCK
jgi:5-methylcytosine-specific restriction endonuclease McrA